MTRSWTRGRTGSIVEGVWEVLSLLIPRGDGQEDQKSFSSCSDSEVRRWYGNPDLRAES